MDPKRTVTRIRHYNPLMQAVHAECVPVLITLASLALLWLAPALQYESTLPASVRAWRAVAGQFAHIDNTHLLLNLVGLWLVAWGLKPWRSPKRDLLLFAAGLGGVCTGLMLSPDVMWYRGLSGALHGLFCGLVMVVLVTERRRPVQTVALVLLAGACVKLLMEDPAFAATIGFFSGAATGPDATNPAWAGFSQNDASRPVLYAAHRWGALAGLAAGALQGLAQRWREQQGPRQP